MIRIIPSLEESHLMGILNLQSRYLYDQQDSEERNTEGFVTIRHDIQLLQEIARGKDHIIAIQDQEVIGYALFMDPVTLPQIPILAPLEKKLHKIEYRDQPIFHYPFFVMGQICIDKKYRRQGLFKSMYYQLRTRYSSLYSCVVTEISQENQRSIGAHLHLGFKIVSDKYDSNWITVLWDWTE